MNASRSFSSADQTWFAQTTGDLNPLHVDARFAAATFPGFPVAHGAHMVLWALERRAANSPDARIEGLAAAFAMPVLVGDMVELQASPGGERLVLSVDGKSAAVVRIGAAKGAVVADLTEGETHWRAGDPPAEHDLQGIDDVAGSVALPSEAAAGLATAFPRLAAQVGAPALAGLASVSALVGMACPGLGGMLSGFELSLLGPATPTLAFAVRKYDPRLARLEIAVRGLGVAGTVTAFVNRAPTVAADAEIASLAPKNAFVGQRPLIVGATSGLGAASARLLAAGGARPAIGWREGAEAQAAALAATIGAAGGCCDLVRFDVCDPAGGVDALAQLGWEGEQVYYFASPRIFRRRLGVYRPSDLRDFLAIYVDALHDTVVGLHALRSGAPLTVFYPSSVAVEDATGELLEYRMAKLASEQLCAALERSHRGLRIVSPRLPRIDTRQTQSLIRARAERPEIVMAPYVIEVQAHSSASP